MAEANYSIKATIEANAKKFKSAIQVAKNSAERFKGTMEKIKDNKIDVDSTGVTKSVEKAKAELETFEKFDPEAHLGLDIKEVIEKFGEAKGYLESFKTRKSEAKLDADILELEHKIGMAELELSSLKDEYPTVEVDAKIDKLESKIMIADEKLQELNKEKIKVEVRADIKEAFSELKSIQSYMEKLDGKNIDAIADVDITKGLAKIEALEANLDNIDSSFYDAELSADATKARVAIAEAKKSLNSFARQKAKATVEVNEGAAVSKILALKAMLRSIPNKIRTRVDVDTLSVQKVFSAMAAGIDNSMKTWDALASRIRTVGTVISNMIQGALISNLTLVVPIIASMVPALMAVLNAIGVVAGGAAGMAAAFGVAAGGVMGFGVMAASAIKMLSDGTLQATAATQRYQSALDGLKSAWEGVIKQNQSEIFNTLANGINTAKVALAGLSPFISGVSKGMEQASAKMLDWAKNSQVAQKFFQVMGTTGVR
ncbi:hypothetical protein ACSGF6_12685, partial [Staphylococcus capitis]